MPKGLVLSSTSCSAAPTAGPGQPYDIYAPLVIYGDTSQDGVWYGGDPHTQSLHNFGPKPMPQLGNTCVVTHCRTALSALGLTRSVMSE